MKNELSEKESNELLKALQTYTKREFGTINYRTIDDITSIINVAQTTTKSGKKEIRVDFNLEKLQWEEYINNVLRIVIEYECLEDFIFTLNHCSFDSIVEDILDMAEKIEKRNDCKDSKYASAIKFIIKEELNIYDYKYNDNSLNVFYEKIINNDYLSEVFNDILNDLMEDEI